MVRAKPQDQVSLRTVLALAAGLLIVLGVSAVLYTAFPASTLFYITNIPSDVVLAAAATMSVVAAVRADGRERLFWSFLALATGLQLPAEIVVLVQQATGTALSSSVTTTSIGGLLSIGATIAMFALLFSLAPVTGGWLERTRAVTDIVIFIAMGTYGVFVLVVSPLMAAYGASVDAQLLGTTRVVIAIAILGGLAIDVFGFPGRRWPSWDRAVATGLAVSAVVIACWPVWYIATVLNGNGWADFAFGAGLTAGAYLLAVGAYVRLAVPGEALERPRPQTAWGQPGAWAVAVIPAVEVTALLLALMTLWLVPDGSDAELVTIVVACALPLLVLRSAALRAQLSRAARDSSLDSVSGAYTTAERDRMLADQVTFARRVSESLSVLEVDIDGFGRINDRLGHMAGDALLRSVAVAIDAVVPVGAYVFRSGSDSFTVTLPGVGRDRVDRVAEDVLAAVAGTSSAVGGPVSASAGIATLDDQTEAGADLAAEAESALLDARTAGQGSILAWDPSVPVHSWGRRDYSELVGELATLVELRSEFDFGHGGRVADLAAKLAESSCMSPADIDQIRKAGRLHDLGKIGVPDRVLDNPTSSMRKSSS